MALLDNWNPLEALERLAGKAIDAKAASSAFDGNSAPYGVDEYGRAYLRGQPSGPGAIDPRLLLLGGGILAIALVVFLAKS